MLVTLLGIVIDVRPEQPEKAKSPMLVTLLGIVMDVRLEQPEKAASSMLVTRYLTSEIVTVEGMVISPEYLYGPDVTVAYEPLLV